MRLQELEEQQADLHAREEDLQKQKTALNLSCGDEQQGRDGFGFGWFPGGDYFSSGFGFGSVVYSREQSPQAMTTFWPSCISIGDVAMLEIALQGHKFISYNQAKVHFIRPSWEVIRCTVVLVDVVHRTHLRTRHEHTTEHKAITLVHRDLFFPLGVCYCCFQCVFIIFHPFQSSQQWNFFSYCVTLYAKN